MPEPLFRRFADAAVIFQFLSSLKEGYAAITCRMIDGRR